MAEEALVVKEKSLDEKVGSVVGDPAENIKMMVLKQMRETGDTFPADELLDERYAPENYEATLVKIARHKTNLSMAEDEIKALREYPVGLAAWGVGRGILEEQPAKSAEYIAEKLGFDGGSTSEDGRKAIAKSLHAFVGLAPRDSGLIKTLNISQPGPGGILTRGTQVDSFFKPLRNQSIVLRFGPPIRQIVDGAITVTGLESDISATWGEEVNTQDLVSEPVWGDRDRTSKHLMVLVPIGIAALRSTAGPVMMRDINDSIRFAFGLEFDTNWINATGGQFRPTGLRFLAGTTTNSSGDSLANIVDDMKGLMKRQAANNVPMRNPGLLMSNREKIELQFLLDVNDRMPFRAEIENGTFFAVQVEGSNEIAINENGNESFVLSVDFGGVLIGMGDTLEINTWDQGSYTVNGEIRHPIQRRERVIAAHSETLLLVAQKEHIEELDQVTWGV